MRAGLKTLSSAEVVAVLEGFGFAVHSHKGSHIKLRRDTAGGRQTLTVPVRKHFAIGTLRAIFSQAARYVSEADLRPHFYTE